MMEININSCYNYRKVIRVKRIGIFLFVFLCIIVPFNVNAESIKITTYDVEVFIQKNGSVAITEHVKLSSVASLKVRNNYLDCNGLNKIMYSGLDNDLYGSDLYIPKLVGDIQVLDKTNEPVQFYKAKKTLLGEEYSFDNIDEVYIKYTLEDSVIKHSDKAEFYYNFFKDKFDLEIQKATISIKLPTKSNYLKATDYSSFSNSTINSNEVIFKYNKVKDKNIRVVFDKNLVESTKITDKQITKLIENDIDNRFYDRLKNYICIGLTILFYIIFIRLVILTIIKYGKNKKYKITPSLDETVIKKYNYAGINYLMNKDIKIEAFMAGIIDLINSDKLDIIKESGGKYSFIRGSSSSSNLTVDEEYLVNFLLEIVDKKYNAPVDILSFNKLKQFCHDNTTVSSFIVNFNVWKTLQVRNAREYRFMVGNEYYFSLRNSLIFSYILLIINIAAKTYFAPGIVAFIPVTLLVNAMLKLTKRSQAAEEAYRDVLNFRQGLIKIAPKTTDEHRWDLFLIDGVTVGCGYEIEKIIKNKIKNGSLHEHYDSKIIRIYRTYEDFSIVSELLPHFLSASNKSFFMYTKGRNNL